MFWKLIGSREKSNKHTNYQNGVISVDSNYIFLAAPLNRKAKRAGVMTKDNCDAYIVINDQRMIYNDGSVEYRIPLSAIKEISDGAKSDMLNHRNSYMMHEISIHLTVGSYIELCIEESETGMRKSEPGHNNTVVIDDLLLTLDDHNALFEHIVRLVDENKQN